MGVVPPLNHPGRNFPQFNRTAGRAIAGHETSRYLSLVLLTILLPLQGLLANCQKGDCFNGQGVYIFSSGAKYVGNFRSGQIHGVGTLYFSNGNRYTGDWVSQYREGKGRMIFKNGDEYFGDFKRNRMTGKGVMQFAAGDRYDGIWFNDKPHGEGVYRFKEGDRYEGQFKEGQFEGLGVMYYPDGAKYIGQWKSNKKHGDGTLFYADGRKVEGSWAAGQFQNGKPAPPPVNGRLRDCNKEFCQDGTGVYTYRDGSRYEGSFRNGQPEGQGKVAYPNGDRYEGGWSNHAPHGEGIMYYTSGRVIGAEWKYGTAVRFLEGNEEKVRPATVPVDRDSQVKIWAVVVGVGRYTHMQTLKYADDDAYQMYAFLKSPEGGALPDKQVRILIDDDATRVNILQAMQQFLLKADENDVVMFYFSGHGLEGSFLPSDYDGYNNRLRHDEIKDLLQRSRAKHKLVLADACHSGTLLAARKPLHETLQKYYAAFENTNGGLALLMSSKGEEVSLEDGGLRSGIFSHFLIRGLKGEADQDTNQIVSVQELFSYVQKKVRDYTGNIQTPTLSGNYDKNMPVAVVRH